MDTIAEQPSASGGAQTSAPYPVMNEIGTPFSIPAGEGASPSLPIPTQHAGPASQQIQQIEARLYQRYQDLAERREEKWFRRSQEYHSEWYQRYESKNREVQEKSAEIAGLIVAVLHEKAERMKSEHKFNLYGALELIVHHAKLIKKIRSNRMSGIQDGIDELAGTAALVAALQDEVAARKLTLGDVTARIGCIYNTVSKHANGNDFIITLYEDHYTREECAVLAAFLRVQSGWPGGFRWERVKRRR